MKTAFAHKIALDGPSSRRLLLAALTLVLFLSGCAGLTGHSVSTNSSFVRADTSEGVKAVVDQYRQLIPEKMRQQNVPGLALAVVDEQGVVWKEGFGCTDTDCARPATPDTLFSVQSTSKTVTATAVMFAIQDGLVDLDTPISKYLPDFHVKSVFEEHPEDKMTLRHLLSHTAGFTHDPPYGSNFDLGPYSFEQHIQSISQTWLKFPVGSSYAYDNSGLDLAAYIVQVRAGKPFSEYAKEKMLAPLGMARSSFDQEQVRRDPDRAIGHSWPAALVPFDLPFVGAGGFYASAAEMAQFIRFHINHGGVDDRQVLDSGLLDTMYAYHYASAESTDKYALGIAHGMMDNLPVLLHGGGGMGFLCDMIWFPDVKLGIILLTNSADHKLQGDVAPGILAKLVESTSSPYHERALALGGAYPSLAHVYDSLRFSTAPPAVSKLAPAPSQADKQRWASYAGLYRFKAWNLVSQLWPFVEKDGQMYLNGTPMVELRPGVFFDPNGEAFDLTGAKPFAGDGMVGDKAKNEMTPVKEALFGLCALGLLSALLVPPGVWISRRARRRSGPTEPRASGRLTRLALFTSMVTALSGLAFLVIIALLPVLLYQDNFALDASLVPEVRLVLSLPFVLGIGALLLVPLTIALWRGEAWSRPLRVHYATVTVAALVLSLMVFAWNVVPFGF